MVAVPDRDEPYNDGGLMQPGRTVTVELSPDECVLVLRDGVWRCARDHEHSGQLAIDTLNFLEQIRGQK